MDQVFSSLAASGPLAAVLGFAVYRLWATLQEERKLEDESRKATVAREDTIRADYEERLGRLRSDHVAMLRETIQALSGAEKKDPQP